MRILGVIFAIFVVLIVAVFAGLQFIDWNKYKVEITDLVEKQTGYELNVDGDLNVAIFPLPHVRIQNVSVLNPAEETPFFSAQRIEVYMDVIPLLSGEIALDSLHVEAPEVFIRELENGVQNWQPPLMVQDETQREDSVNASTPALRINSLTVSGGNVSYQALGENEALQVRDISSKIVLGSLTGPFDVEASFEFDDMPISVDLKANKLNQESNAIPLQFNAQLYDTALSLRFSGVIGYSDNPDLQGETEVTIANVQTLLDKINGQAAATTGSVLSAPVKLSGILSADMEKAAYTNFVADLGTTRFSGRIDAANISSYPNSPIQVNYDLTEGSASAISGSLELEADLIRTDKTVLSYASSDATVSALWKMGDAGGSIPMLAVDVMSSELNMDELMRRFGIDTQSTSQSSRSTADVKAQLAAFDLPFDIGIKADIKNLVYQNNRIQNILADLSLKSNQLDITKFSIANYAGASVDLSGKVGELTALNDIDVSLSTKTSDAESTLQKLGMQDALSSVSFKIGGVDATVNAAGNPTALKFESNVNALNASMMVAGNAANILDNPVFKDLSFGVKHPNLENLLRVVNPAGATAGTGLSKPVNISARVGFEENVYTFHDIDGALGSMTLGGNIQADLSQAVPMISGTIDTGVFPVDSFMGASGSGANSDVRWSREAIDFSWMKQLALNLDITSQNISYQSWSFTNAKFGLELANNTLSIPNWSAGFFGGTSAANLSVNGPSSEGQPAKISGGLQLDNVGLQPLISSFTGVPLVQSNGTTDFEASINTSGVSIAAFIYGLNGDGSIDGDDITIKGIDVADLSRAASRTDSLGRQAEALFKTGIRGGSSEFDKLTGEFTIREGVVNFDPLLLAGKDADVTTTGDVSLPAWTIDMRSAIQLHVDSDAEVPPPIEVSYRGSLSNPSTSFAQEAIQNFISQKVQSKVQDLIKDKVDGELGGVLNNIIGGKNSNDNQEGGAQQRQQEPLQGILKNLIK